MAPLNFNVKLHHWVAMVLFSFSVQGFLWIEILMNSGFQKKRKRKKDEYYSLVTSPYPLVDFFCGCF